MNKRVRQSFSVLLLIVAAAHLAGAAMGGEPEPGKGKAAGGEARFETFTAEQKAHWAYQPLKRPEPPSVRQSRWVRNPIDRFILAELESVELPHAPEADRIALIRRVDF